MAHRLALQGSKYAFAFACAIAAPIAAMAQATLGTPQAVIDLVKTACIFDTLNPAAELPRSHAALIAAGLPVVNQTPMAGFFGDPSGTFFISNFTDDGAIACAAKITAADLDQFGFEYMIIQIEAMFSERYGDHIFDPGEDGTSWIAKHPDGTRTVITTSFHHRNGTDFTSLVAVDD